MVDVVGGPLDGLIASSPTGHPWRWLGRSSRDAIARCYSKAAPRRLLYRWHDGVWLYAGDLFRVCQNCAALVRNPEGGRERQSCGLCGEAPVLT